MNEENFRQLKAARVALKKVRRAVLSARIEGYTIAVFGGISVLTGLSSPKDLLVGTVLTAIGIIEIVCAGKLARLDVSAAKWLGINQLALAIFILLYAGWNLHAEISHPATEDTGLSQQDQQVLDENFSEVTNLTHEIMLALYGSLALAAVAEAGMAWYYHSRGEYVKRFLEETPEWIVAMQRAGVSV